MPTPTVTNSQILELVKQLPDPDRAKLFEWLLQSRWETLDRFIENGEAHARLTAWKRGLDWDSLTEEQRIDFVDNIIHEDRLCRQ